MSIKSIAEYLHLRDGGIRTSRYFYDINPYEFKNKKRLEQKLNNVLEIIININMILY